MANNKLAAPAKSVGKKTRFSIVLKLKTHFMLRLLSVFISMDIFACVAFSTAFYIYAETSLATLAENVEQYGVPAGDSAIWLSSSGYSVTPLDSAMKGYTIPNSFRSLLPSSTSNLTRSMALGGTDGDSFIARLKEMTFSVGLSVDKLPYRLSFHPGTAFIYMLYVFPAIFVLELITLFSSLFTGSNSIRKILRPISELAETARSLSEGSGTFSPEDMEKLAGKLNNITAARLDTRISVDSTQIELKNLALSINGMLERISESYRSQVRFVSDASHELRTPISVIQGYANLLDRWGKNDKKTMQESIDAIKEETANMKLLVEQLLFLARGDNNTMKLQMERFDASALVGEVLSETRMIDGGHEYTSRLEPVIVNADYALLKQGLRVLVDNAIKYTPAGGQIRISAYPDGENARLCVQDEGIGIPSKDIPKIFDRFYRADESRARATGGTGLGLSIAKWIVERHGGHLEVLSRENIGTKITVVLQSSADFAGADQETGNAE